MGEWKERKLESFATIIKDQFNPAGTDDFLYIGLEHIEQEALRLNSVGTSSEVTSNKFKFRANDILFGKLRPYFRKVVKPSFDGICSTDIWVIRAKEGFSQDYLFYFLANWEFVDTANSAETGSRMPRADWGFLKDTIWKVPDLPEQKAIAEVLSSLDDKIDLLHRQNKTLESLAQTLFRQWFIEEAKPDWPETSLEEHVEVVRGLSYRGSGLTTASDGLPMHNLNSVYEFGGYKPDGIKYYKGDYKERHQLKAGDLIVANTEQGHEYRLIGFPAIVPDTFGQVGLFSQHIYKVVRLPSSGVDQNFLYHLLRTPEVRQQVIAATNGSTVNMLAVDGLKRPTFRLPPVHTLNEFSVQSQSFEAKRRTNRQQIEILTSLRDALLPRLISGAANVQKI
jgi:type I restriction enzyme S subunit